MQSVLLDQVAELHYLVAGFGKDRSGAAFSGAWGARDRDIHVRWNGAYR